MTGILAHVASYVLLSAVVPLSIFIARYIRHSPFQVTKEGINLLLSRLAMLLIIVLFITRMFLPDYPGRGWVVLISYVALVYFFWVDLVQLLRVQRQYPFTRHWHRRDSVHR
jgi:hypothetical protein